jgi:hypothetical protein
LCNIWLQIDNMASEHDENPLQPDIKVLFVPADPTQPCSVQTIPPGGGFEVLTRLLGNKWLEEVAGHAFVDETATLNDNKDCPNPRAAPYLALALGPNNRMRDRWAQTKFLGPMIIHGGVDGVGDLLSVDISVLEQISRDHRSRML